MTRDPILNAITEARVGLLFSKPFFGTLVMRLNPVDASKWCKTAATDGRYLFFNRDFIKSLNQEELKFLIAHEILHCVYDHLGRRGERKPDIWNMANDYIVNYTLVKEKVGSMPKMGLYNDKFTDVMTSEEVYDILMKNATKVQVTLDEHLELGQGNEDGDESGQNKPDGQPGDKPGKGTVAEVTVMNPDPASGDGPPSLTEEELEQIRNELRRDLINAAQTAGAGNLPAGIARLIKTMTDPVMDWRALLDMHIRSSIRDDFSFARVNRRSFGLGVILPGMDVMETIEVAAALDASGSISDEMLGDFLSELKGLMETFPDFKVHLWSFDAKVHGYKLFTPDNLDEILNYEVKGGGGTSFECNWDYMKRMDLNPKRFVMFTDGYPNAGWGDPDYVETLFIIHKNRGIQAPFGLTAIYEPKQRKKLNFEG